MNALKKTLNVFGILLAWLLSIALVVLLIAAPTALSALSILEPETITGAVWDALGAQEPSAAVPQIQTNYGVVSLSAKNENVSNEASVDQILGDLDMSRIEELIGEEIDNGVVNKIIASDAVKEIVEAYVGDVADAITGKTGETRFSAEKLVKVVEENIDEITQIVQEVAPDLSQEDVKELKNEIVTVVRDNAEKIVEELPAPEEIKDAIVGTGTESELILAMLAQRDNMKLAIVGAIVLLSLLIFLLRIPGFRGFRWLSVDLFVAGGFGALVCVALKLGSSAITGLVNELEELDIVGLKDIILNIVSAFTGGVVIRTGIILAAAVVLMIVYILIKVLRKKKSAAPAVVPATVVAAEECAPAAVEADDPNETASEQQTRSAEE